MSIKATVDRVLNDSDGDIYPITFMGKILGAFIAFLGIGLVAVPTGILSAGFIEVSKANEK